MTETPTPYGSPCGPSYEQLKEQLKERDETIERLVSFYKKESDFDFKYNKNQLTLNYKLLEKLNEETQLISKMGGTLVKSLEVIKYLERKVKTRTYLAAGALIFGLCSLATTAYTTNQLQKMESPSSLDQKITLFDNKKYDRR